MPAKTLFLIFAFLLEDSIMAAELDNLKSQTAEFGECKGIERLDFKSGVDGTEDFALALPPKDSDIWVVCLHGHGSRGDQLFTRPDIKAQWLPDFLNHGFGILAPNIRGNSWMCDAAVKDLHALLQEIRRRYGARGFIFVAGSMGGTASLIYASIHPGDVMACIALCPATDLPSYRAFAGTRPAPVMKEIAAAIDKSYGDDKGKIAAHSALARKDALTMPLFIVHATDDPTIPVEQSRMLANALAGRPNFKYVEIHGGHDSPLPYEPEGLSWICGKLGADASRQKRSVIPSHGF